MSFNQDKYPSSAALVGNVDLLRNVNPTIRSGLRRSDSDGVSNTPYYPGVSGKFLRIAYTKEVASVVTASSVDVSLSSASYDSIITTINAADTSNIEAFDSDGFLTIRNKNPGKTHNISIQQYSPTVDDASTLLGFPYEPYPGSVSYAGEVAPAPGNRIQSNPRTTSLIARNDDLSSAELNRSFYSILQMVEDSRADLARDAIVYKDVSLTFANHPTTTTKRVARINDDSIRLFYPSVASGGVLDLEPYFRVLTTNHDQAVNSANNYPTTKVTQIYYATGATALDSSTVFSTWGTPDGKTIISNATPNKTKHSSTVITSIKGNAVYCASADFTTAKVKPGDPVEFTASNLQPFDHSGWFIVEDIIDGQNIIVRPLSSSRTGESTPSGTGNKPRALNPTGGGTLRVAVGRFIPAGDLWLEVDDTTVTNMIVRLPTGVKLRDRTFENTGNTFDGLLGQLSGLLFSHVSDTTDAHEAASLGGFTSSVLWADSTSSTGANLQATIENVINSLATTLTNGGGTARIGSDAVSIAGFPPNTLGIGTARSQIVELLTKLRDHMNDTSAHGGAGSPYSGSPNWADGSNIPPGVTVDDALDQIVSDLASGATGDDGAQKVGCQVRAVWLGGRTNPSTHVFGAINKIIQDLGANNASDDGAERIGAQSTSDLGSGSVRFQLDSLASGWGKLTRAQSWSATQTMNGTASDISAIIDTTYIPSIRKLMWSAPLESLGAGNNHVRLYAGRNDVDVGFEVSINARWDGTNWNKDGTGQGTRLVLISNGMYLQSRLAGDGGVWTDTLGNWHNPLYFSAEIPTAATAQGPSVTPKNVIRSHGRILTNGIGGFTSTEGFNYTVVITDHGAGLKTLDVTFGTAMANANYTLMIFLDNAGSDYYSFSTASPGSKTASGFTFTTHMFNGTTTALVDPSAVAGSWNFTVMGA
jgi:hypothetical protein